MWSDVRYFGRYRRENGHRASKRNRSKMTRRRHRFLNHMSGLDEQFRLQSMAVHIVGMSDKTQ
jgi:hypothetical protein